MAKIVRVGREPLLEYKGSLWYLSEQDWERRRERECKPIFLPTILREYVKPLRSRPFSLDRTNNTTWLSPTRSLLKWFHARINVRNFCILIFCVFLMRVMKENLSKFKVYILIFYSFYITSLFFFSLSSIS